MRAGRAVVSWSLVEATAFCSAEPNMGSPRVHQGVEEHLPGTGEWVPSG